MRPDRHNRPPWLLDKRLKRIYLYVKESWVAKCGSVCAHRGNTGPLCLISFIHCVSLASPPPPFFPSFYTSLVDDEEKRQRIVSSSILNHHRTLSFLGRGSLVRTQWRCGQQCENKKKNRGACLGERGGGDCLFYTQLRLVLSLYSFPFSFPFSSPYSVNAVWWSLVDSLIPFRNCGGCRSL